MPELSAVFTDLDGTLLRSDQTIHPEDLTTIQILQSQAIPVIIATGRHHAIARPIYEQIGGNVPAITCNGALLYNYQAGQILREQCLSSQAALEVCRCAKAAGLRYHVFTVERSYYTPNDPYLDFEGSSTLPHGQSSKVEFYTLEELGDITAHRVAKVLVSGVDAQIVAHFRKILSNYNLEITTSGAGLMEVNHQGVTKGEAAYWVSRYLGLDLSRTLSLGDNLNDLAMLKATGFSATPDNADLQAKATATVVVPDHDHAPLTWAIRELFPGLLEKNTCLL